MSRTKPTKVERCQLAFDCAACGAPAGEWCTAQGYSTWAQFPHRDRYRQATEAGLIPLLGRAS